MAVRRAILAPTNGAVSVINKELLQNLPGNFNLQNRHDMHIDEAVNYTTEVSQQIRATGVPSHILDLKVGAPIILLRNLDPPALCNGTRLSIKKLMPNIIEATIMTGQLQAKMCFIQEFL
ncbi:uncharacterized protein LOC118182890 [Stegodyphus dumicola]|uniref:uncharacterized protein LOC118182890 n=1 Tax=Stegodyphus dumicola TaxID=202533 RepID=UPI0015AE750A|nr:uncharacterized protein LOC118182890 [Stegodyphus dumicola]